MTWNFVLIEGYCARDWEYDRKHSPYNYIWDIEDEFDKLKQIPNPEYDPDAKKPEKPEFCKGRVCNDCIKCQYFAHCDVEDDFRLRFDKLVEDYMQDECKECLGS